MMSTKIIRLAIFTQAAKAIVQVSEAKHETFREKAAGRMLLDQQTKSLKEDLDIAREEAAASYALASTEYEARIEAERQCKASIEISNQSAYEQRKADVADERHYTSRVRAAGVAALAKSSKDHAKEVARLVSKSDKKIASMCELVSKSDKKVASTCVAHTAEIKAIRKEIATAKVSRHEEFFCRRNLEQNLTDYKRESRAHISKIQRWLEDTMAQHKEEKHLAKAMEREKKTSIQRLEVVRDLQLRLVEIQDELIEESHARANAEAQVCVEVSARKRVERLQVIT